MLPCKQYKRSGPWRTRPTTYITVVMHTICTTNVERSGPRTGPTWEQMFARARLGWAQLGSVGLGAARLDSVRFGPVLLGSARPGSAQLGLVRFGSVRLGAAFVGRVNVVASNMLVAGICLFSESRNKDLPHVRKPIRLL